MSAPDRSWRSVLKGALSFDGRQAGESRSRRSRAAVLIQIKRTARRQGLLWPTRDQIRCPVCRPMGPKMPKAFTYTAREHLSDGNEVEIRALQPDDETDMLAAV